MIEVIGVHGELESEHHRLPITYLLLLAEGSLSTINAAYILTSRNSMDNIALQSPHNLVPVGSYVYKHSRHCALSTAVLRTKN